MPRHPNQWPDEVVLSFPQPWPNGGRTDADWLRMVIDADWLFRHGWDSVDIGEALGVHEAVVIRALAQAREARRCINEGESNASSEPTTAEVDEGGGSVA